MDRGTTTFTSDVSLPKDDKNICWVNKLQLGNWQNYERTAMLILLAESARFNHAGITPKQVDCLSISIYLLIIHLEISNPEHLAGIKLRATTICYKPKATDNCINTLCVMKATFATRCHKHHYFTLSSNNTFPSTIFLSLKIDIGRHEPTI